jgi:parallel beta-helix repeat protein
VREEIQTVHDGITLDGNGHTINIYAVGVRIHRRQNVTIQTLNLQEGYIGIAYSNNCTVTGCTINSSAQYGIYAVESNHNTLSDNILTYNGEGIHLAHNCNNNELTGKNEYCC